MAGYACRLWRVPQRPRVLAAVADRLDGSGRFSRHFGKPRCTDIQTAFRTISGVHFLESILAIACIVQSFHRIELQRFLQLLAISPEPFRDVSG